MTDTTVEATEQPQKAQEPETPDQAQEPPQDRAEDEGNPNAEAKKWRLKLRDVEAERDELREQLTTVQAKLVSDAIANVQGRALRHTDDLFRFSETTAADYLGDDGLPDQDRITLAVAELTRDRPDLAKDRAPVIPNIGDAPRSKAQPDFEAAFAPNRR